MDQFVQTNNDLQAAIDEIANDEVNLPPAPVPEMPAANTMPEVEVVAPVPGVPAQPETTVATEPATEAAEAQEPVIPEVPVPEAPVSEAPAVSGTEALEEIAAGDMTELRKNVIAELLPLMDKVQAEPTEKFQIYMDAISEGADKKFITAAYDTAKQIADETAKAEALSGLLKIIDNKNK